MKKFLIGACMIICFCLQSSFGIYQCWGNPAGVNDPGDINGDQRVDLLDAIQGLQIQCGNEPVGIIPGRVVSEADLTGDGKIGIQDVVGILAEISGLRTSSTEPPIGDQPSMDSNAKTILLHHSTGAYVYLFGMVPNFFANYNATNDTSYSIERKEYPSNNGYGWQNYPYDYWNIWINNAGETPYLTEDTLELLTPNYDVIVLKHCYPVASMVTDTGNPDIASNIKSMENYKLQYEALKIKMRSFPNNRFIVWTGPAQVESKTTLAQGTIYKQFYNWVVNEWDEPGDNIYLWDFYILETYNTGAADEVFLRNEFARSSTDSHPNTTTFAPVVGPCLAQRIIDVIQGKGDTTSINGNLPQCEVPIIPILSQ